MKSVPLLVSASLVALAVLSCSGKRDAATDTAGTVADAPAASSLGDARFSATIDGTPVAGSGVDEMQQRNAAYVLPLAKTTPQHLVFFLYSTKNAADESANYSLRISLPPKPGTYTKQGSTEHSCDCDVTLNENIAVGNLARYWADSVTVTVSAMTPTRVSGTFSGSFVLSSDTPRAPNKRARIVDGQFDIPMATSTVTPE
ncbi:MAG: hypothetical protein M3Y30_09470 [Gemmatimonadota bacterium]|nr:hypothetical protein [Gemmatimonadota bacterium]